MRIASRHRSTGIMYWISTFEYIYIYISISKSGRESSVAAFQEGINLCLWIQMPFARAKQKEPMKVFTFENE